MHIGGNEGEVMPTKRRKMDVAPRRQRTLVQKWGKFTTTLSEEDAHLPTETPYGQHCYKLCSPIDDTIGPHETYTVRTGINVVTTLSRKCVSIGIYSLINGVHVMDRKMERLTHGCMKNDYIDPSGSLNVNLLNDTDMPVTIEGGKPFALFEIQQCPSHQENSVRRLSPYTGRTRPSRMFTETDPRAEPRALLPRRVKSGSGCFAVFARTRLHIKKNGEKVMVPLGFSLRPPPGHHAQIHNSPTRVFRKEWCIPGGTKIIDEDYRDEIYLCLKAAPGYGGPSKIRRGDVLALLEIVKTNDIGGGEEKEATELEERTGGFGSTGK